mmetsp:Transcript_121739/g.289416  ORF Transcript_121739/g.289416 Transcript_121739/m.289416 type:complete len:287 (-) Transcript_121739:586-1446(-)
MVVKCHGQVILDQVLPGDPEVHGVPEPELFAHLVQSLLRDLAVLGVRPVQEDKVPHFIRQIRRLDAGRAALLPIQVALTVQQVGNGVVGHVDGTVRQGLDDELLIPRDLRSQAKGTAARPFLQPPDGVFEGLLDAVVVADEVGAVQVALDLTTPALRAVLQVPLINGSHHALIARSRNHLLLRLGVDEGLLGLNHDRAELELCLLHWLALERSDRHGAFVEAQLVASVVGLCQLHAVVDGLHPQLLTHVLGGHGPHLPVDLHVNDRDQIKALHPLLLHAVVLPLLV